MSANYMELEEFARKIERLNQAQQREFMTACAKELAARLLAKVIRRTPVGIYSDGRTGGTLRRGWTAGQSQNATAYANSLTVNRVGNTYQIEIINPVEYASYVEYGHRTANHSGWVEGRHMLTISEEEINQSTQAILQRKLDRYIREVFE